MLFILSVRFSNKFTRQYNEIRINNNFIMQAVNALRNRSFLKYNIVAMLQAIFINNDISVLHKRMHDIYFTNRNFKSVLDVAANVSY